MTLLMCGLNAALAGFRCQLDTSQSHQRGKKEPQLRKDFHEIQLEGVFSISDGMLGFDGRCQCSRKEGTAHMNPGKEGKAARHQLASLPLPPSAL